MNSTSPTTVIANDRLKRSDAFLLAAFCLLLFGYSMFSGRPLSLHEARLPQCSREMLQNGDWIIPRSGGRPWLERPPFPHWVTVTTSKLLGQHCDTVWVVRLPAALMGSLTVVIAAWIASVWFGRQVGLCTGLILATAYEFYAYSTLAEDDIFLAALVISAVALFVKIQFPPPDAVNDNHIRILGSRPWPVFAFFILLGLTNFAKGPLVGASVIIGVVGTFLLLICVCIEVDRVRRGFRVTVLLESAAEPPTNRNIWRFVWLWGWLLFLLLTAAWPLAVYHRYPEVLENWRFDYAGGTTQYDQPFWYYPFTLLGEIAPWTPLAFIGLAATARKASRSPASPERFLWCWAIIPILILSLPHRKHHHYLVPNLAPWAILCAVGLVEVAKRILRPRPNPIRPIAPIAIALAGAAVLLAFYKKIPSPFYITTLLAGAWIVIVALFYHGVRLKRPTLLMATFVCGIAIAYSWGESSLPDQTTQDTLFLKRVNAAYTTDHPLYINSDLHGELDFFRISFYLPKTAILLHNLSYLRDERIHDPVVFIITRAKDLPALETLGEVHEILQSAKTRRETSPADRFTLFSVKFRPDLHRYPAPTDISTMEAMGRKTGPWCGPPL